jgi:MerR family transcriptional regulator, mercuric resistance operon regulatory protein
MSKAFTIGRLAEAAGVHVETVRYYQRRGLLAEPPRPLGGVRCYSDRDALRLRFIKRAQAVGFTLAEVGSLLNIRQHQSCRATRALVAEKLFVVEARVRELQRLRRELRHWIEECDANTRDTSCPALAVLEDPGMIVPGARVKG